MKKVNPLIIATLLIIPLLCSSCEVIEGIFKAGMGFGILIVIAVIALIATVIFKLGNRD